MSGCSQGQVSHLLHGRRGKNPSAATVAALAAALQVREEWLRDGSGARDIEGDEEPSHVRAKAPPEFEAAVAWVRPRGVSSAAVALMRAWAQAAPVPLTERTWVDILEAAERRISEGQRTA